MAPRVALNLVTFLLLTLGTGALILFATLFLRGYESNEIGPFSPAAFLFIPAELRAIEPAMQCAPKQYLRNLGTCSEACGDYVGVSFGTLLDLPTLQDRYPLTPLLSATGRSQGQVMMIDDWPGDPEGCSRAVIELYRPEG